MGKYGFIKVTNVSLSDEIFNKVCKTLKLISGHNHQEQNAFFLYGIDNDKQQFNVDRGGITRQSTCFLDAINFYLSRDFSSETIKGLTYEYVVD